MNIELTEVFVAVHDINDDGGEIFHSLVVTIITSSVKHSSEYFPHLMYFSSAVATRFS